MQGQTPLHVAAKRGFDPVTLAADFSHQNPEVGTSIPSAVSFITAASYSDFMCHRLFAVGVRIIAAMLMKQQVAL